MRTIKIFSALFFCLLWQIQAIAQQFCNPSGNVVIYSNYEGGYLNINIDQNIPNLKIGVCTYEAVQVNISGAFAGNVTQVVFAGFGDVNNTGCGATIPAVSINGVAPNLVTIYSTTNGKIPISPYLGNPLSFVGIPLINCITSGGDCVNDTNDSGGGNSAPQIVQFFLAEFGAGSSLYFHQTDYDCFSASGYSLSSGGNCCLQNPTSAPNPIFVGGSEYNFLPSDTILCNGPITLDLSFYPVLFQPPIYPGYVWSNGTTGPIITITQPGTYSFTVGDYCHAYGNFLTDTIVVLPCSCFTASLQTSNADCFGIANGAATINTNQPGAYTYNWLQIPSATGASVSGLAAGDYMVMVSQPATGCDTTILFTIEQPLPIFSTHYKLGYVCTETVNLFGMATYLINNPAGLYDYDFYLDAQATVPVTTPINVPVPGNYYVVASDNSCTDTLHLEYVLLPTLDMAALTTISDTSVCIGDTVLLSFIDILPEAYIFSIDITPDASYTVIDGTISAQLLFTNAGSYTIDYMLFDVTACPSMVTYTVQVADLALHLLPDTTLTPGQSVLLTNTTSGNIGEVTYEWQPNTALSCANCPTPIASPTQTTTYTLRATDTQSGCVEERNITVFVVPNAPNLITPNAFSPNGDGVNDLWRVVSANINQFSASVYNRWGQLVFETADPANGWDGSYKGVNLEIGVYVYFITGTYTNGETFAQRGDITLIR